jgi:class 3 adenylate cyclase
MKKVISKIHTYFIPKKYFVDDELLRRSRILVNTTIITSIFAFFYLLNTIAFGMHFIKYNMILCSILFLLFAFLFRWGFSRLFITNCYVGLATFATIYDIYFSGGLVSWFIPWLSLGPISAVLLYNKKVGWFWTVVCSLSILAIGILHQNNYPFPFDTPVEHVKLLTINSQIGLVIILFVLCLVLDTAYIRSIGILTEKNFIIEKEKKRSDELLLNILPYEIAEELKRDGKATTRQFDNVSVLFTDFVGFTKTSEQLTPKELVEEINACFTAFDGIIERNGLEKIKTIGDAYLAVCGLPNEAEGHAIKTVNAAIEIMEFINKRELEGGKFKIRIGVNSGPVVAGIVGVKKFAYDIWGDTVNTASRMEQHSQNSKINISGSTYELIKNSFRCTPRGKIEAKNKGEVDMYFVDGKI